jgi:hypothetical protein
MREQPAHIANRSEAKRPQSTSKLVNEVGAAPDNSQALSANSQQPKADS